MLQNRPALHHTEPLKDTSETDNGGCNHTLQNGTREETDNGRNNSCMRKEANRLKSFVNWPCKFLKPEQLAKAGFYYTQYGDKVRCPFCNVEVGQWEEGDDPLSDHARWSGSCVFLRQRPCGNISIEEDPNPVMPQGYDTCGKYGIEVRPNSFPGRESDQCGSQENSLRKYGVQSNLGTAHPNYALLEKRLASFSEWPPSIKQTPKQLAEAGFFYNQKGDQTICFYCGGGLKDWVPCDDPWEQHAKWFSNCGFVRLQKGSEYISEVCNRLENAVITSEEASGLQMTETNNLNKNNISNTTGLQASSLNIVDQKTSPKSLTEENTVSENTSSEGNKPGTTSTLCKICYSKEVGVVFLPCGHIVACVDCAPALTTCAVCRKPLEAIVRAFLS
ncbi:death-associated inhibitor of apoptosis 1 [Agrilus planipennis]|uniref:Death-associated inhibitor of apoptosis 1 n=1 Tax=Agrilus planipennis TaxID=224129 RepID=A0A1W4XE66_AGRPL|nr:death-associated inhibitor of apoptosis 1 [Agrilus planipennis]XP_018331061.1 death-associated inhibitor of apoptosis 1 [Agrilus planipennis]XP_018331062.1 death-associated inhibitor of apoptosis 1 [Agrilus planipennis]